MRTRAKIVLAGSLLGVALAAVTSRGTGIPVLPLWLLPTTIAGVVIAWWPRRDDKPGSRILDLLTLFALVVPSSLVSIFWAAQSRTQPAHIRYHGVRLTNASAVAIGANADSLDVSLQGGQRGEPWKVTVVREPPPADGSAGSSWKLDVTQPPEELLVAVNGSPLARRAAGVLNIEFWQPLTGATLRSGDSTSIDVPDAAAFGLPAGRYPVSLTQDGDDLVLSVGGFSWYVWRRADPLNFRNQAALRRGQYLGQLRSRTPMPDALLPDLVRIRELGWRERVGEAKTLRAMLRAWLNELRADSPLQSRYLVTAGAPLALENTLTSGQRPPAAGAVVEMVARHGGDSWRFQWMASGTNVDVEFSRRPRIRSFPLTASNSCSPGAACNVAGLRRLPPPVEQILLSEGGLDSTRFTLFGRFLAANRSVWFVSDSSRIAISSEGKGSWLPAGRVTPGRGLPSAFVRVSAARNSVANPFQVIFISAGLTCLLMAMFFAIRAGVAEGTVRVGALAERPFALALLALLALALSRLILGLRVTVFAPFNALGVSTAVGLWVSLATAVGALLTWKLWYPSLLDWARGANTRLGARRRMKSILDRLSKLRRQFTSLPRDVRVSVILGGLAVACLVLTTPNALAYGAILGVAVPALWAGISSGVVWASNDNRSVISSCRVGAWGFLEAHLPAQGAIVLRIVLISVSSGLVAVLYPVVFLVLAVFALLVTLFGRAFGWIVGRKLWEPSQHLQQLVRTVIVLGAPLSVLALASASKSAAALGLALYVGMVALRLTACFAQASESSGSTTRAWLSAIGLPFAVLVLLLPLVAIDVGLFLVVLIPVMLASIIAAGGSRSGSLRRAVASLVLVFAVVLIGMKLLGQPADRILTASPVEVDRNVRSMQSWLYLDRIPKLRRSLANVAARGLAARDQRAAERALLLAGPSETRDFLAPAIEQSWGTKAYSAAGWRGVGLGEAPIGNRGIAAAVSYAEHSFAVFVMAEHGLLGGMTVILLYVLLAAAAIGMLALRTDLLIGARNFSMRALLFLSAGLVIVPATYVALSNVGVLPITGQNMPFLGLNARSDVLFTTGALSFFLIAAMRLHREAVGQSAIRSRTDA